MGRDPITHRFELLGTVEDRRGVERALNVRYHEGASVVAVAVAPDGRVWCVLRQSVRRRVT